MAGVASSVRGVRNESEELGGGLEVQRDWSYGLPQKMIFEGGRVSLGIQNRPQEVPRGDKKRHRKTNQQNIRPT